MAPPVGGGRKSGAVTPWYVGLLLLGPAAFAIALWKGGRGERLGAAILLVNYAVTGSRLLVPPRRGFEGKRLEDIKMSLYL